MLLASLKPSSACHIAEGSHCNIMKSTSPATHVEIEKMQIGGRFGEGLRVEFTRRHRVVGRPSRPQNLEALSGATVLIISFNDSLHRSSAR